MADKYVSAHDPQSPLYSASPARDPHLGVFDVSDRLIRILQAMISAVPALAGFIRPVNMLIADMAAMRAELYPEDAIAAQKAIDDAEIERLAQVKVKAAQAATTPQQVNDLLDQHSTALAASTAASAEAADAQAAAVKEVADKAATLDAAATARAKEILAGETPPAVPTSDPAYPTAAEIAAARSTGRQPARVAP